MTDPKLVGASFLHWLRGDAVTRASATQCLEERRSGYQEAKENAKTAFATADVLSLDNARLKQDVAKRAERVTVLEREVRILQHKVELQRGIARVYRNKWEQALKAERRQPSEEDQKRAAGLRLIETAISQRTPPGDTRTADYLRRFAELALAKPNARYEEIADQILRGDADDDELSSDPD